MSSWLDYFIGSSQSRYAFFAIFSALVAICMAIIFTNSDIAIVNRMIIVVFVLFVSMFPVGISLFELTCMVNGSNSKSKLNPCSTYAWIVTAMIVIYCFFLIIATVISMFTYKKAISKVEQSKDANAISNKDANIIAKNIIVQEEEKETFVQKPSDAPEMPSVAPEMMPPASQEMPSIASEMPTVAPEMMPPVPEMTPVPKLKRENKLSGPVGNSDDAFGGAKKGSEDILGYDSQDGFMSFNTKETFVNAPKAPSAKRPVKKMQKSKPDFSSPKPFEKQIETFANI